jgi:hypothetical protein
MNIEAPEVAWSFYKTYHQRAVLDRMVKSSEVPYVLKIGTGVEFIPVRLLLPRSSSSISLFATLSFFLSFFLSFLFSFRNGVSDRCRPAARPPTSTASAISLANVMSPFSSLRASL